MTFKTYKSYRLLAAFPQEPAFLFYTVLFHRHHMAPELLLRLHLKFGKSGFPEHLLILFFPIGSDVPVAHKMAQRQLNMVDQPHHHVIGGIIPQNQAAVFPKHAPGFVQKSLGIRVMMKAIRTDNHIKRLIRKGQRLAVAHQEFRIR